MLCSSPEAVLIWSFGMRGSAKTSQQRCTRALCVLLGIIAVSSMARAAELRVAVASNFAATLSLLAESFEARTGHTMRASVGSTGKLYAQIVNGAPFDVLLAADAHRPTLLEQSGNAVAGTRFTYARGRLVLWSNDPGLGADDCLAALEEQKGKVAIANPNVAPYGAAAQATLRELDLWDVVKQRLVTGENVAQVLHFVSSGNARLGFVAEAQLANTPIVERCLWRVPQSYHEPIAQQAVLLRRASETSAARDFLAFLRGAEAQHIVSQTGYDSAAGE